jgi:lipopolysaccharide transport system permease protein
MKSISNLYRTMRTRRDLIGELVHRELRDRHAGQNLGRLWAFGHPLLLMVIYTILFAYVFPTRFSTGGAIQDFSVNVLVGILPWLAFQDLLARSPSILIGHANLVKQIVFPTEVLPIKTAIASALPYVFSLVFAVGYAGWKGSLSWFALILPFVIICQLAAMIGMAFLLAAIGVFLKDLRELVQIFCTVNLFAQPILYNPFATPEILRNILFFNPFSYLIWCWQDALFLGTPIHIAAWIFLPLGSVGLLLIGWINFHRMSHAFGDAL